MRTGETVRLRPGSPLGPLLGRMADACGRVSHTCQIDDDGLQIAVSYDQPEEAHTSLLPAEEFEIVAATGRTPGRTGPAGSES